MKKNNHTDFLMSLIRFIRDFKTRNVPDLVEGGILNKPTKAICVHSGDPEVFISEKHRKLLEKIVKEGGKITLGDKIHGTIKAHSGPKGEHEL